MIKEATASEGLPAIWRIGSTRMRESGKGAGKPYFQGAGVALSSDSNFCQYVVVGSVK
jgi:hypothetical protein